MLEETRKRQKRDHVVAGGRARSSLVTDALNIVLHYWMAPNLGWHWNSSEAYLETLKDFVGEIQRTESEQILMDEDAWIGEKLQRYSDKFLECAVEDLILPLRTGQQVSLLSQKFIPMSTL